MSAPVIIVKYNPKWPELFREERKKILVKIVGLGIQVEHIGGTAVPGLGAKPIIDIMIGIEGLSDAEKCITLLEEIGYILKAKSVEDVSERKALAKSINGTKIHIYIVEANTDNWEKNILFRNYLLAHPETAKEYNKLKVELAKNYKNDQIAYTKGKAKFIKKVESKASKERKKYTS